MIFNVPNLAVTESTFVLCDSACFVFFLKCFRWRGTELRQVLIFSYTLFCISLPPVRDGELFMISKQGQEVEVFWLQGRFFFKLIYQTWKLASYYLEYSLTLAVKLCETGMFMTCMGKVSQGCEGDKDRTSKKFFFKEINGLKYT